MEQKAEEAELQKSGIPLGIKMQHAVYIRGIAESTKFKFQSGKLVNIIYFKLEYFSIKKMIKQGLNFGNINRIR